MDYLKIFENSRDKWNDLYSSHFDDEKKKIDIADKLTIIGIVISICAFLVSLMVISDIAIYISIILSFLLLIITLFQKFYTIQAKSERQLAELGRRSSYFINLVDFEHLTPIIHKLKSDYKKGKHSAPDWYYSIDAIDNDDYKTNFAKDFLQSLFFQATLMKLALKEKKTKCIRISLTPIFIVITIIILANRTMMTNWINLLWGIFVLIVLMVFDDLLNLKRFSEHFKKVEEIFVQVDGIIRKTLNKDRILKSIKSFFELIRQQMEYSIIMDQILPVSEEIYNRNREKMNNESKKLLEEIFTTEQ